jgi:hypothetical protein
MNSHVDAGCPHCGYAFRWLSGTALRCPRCRHLLHPQPITRGQYLREKEQLPSLGDASVDRNNAGIAPQREESPLPARGSHTLPVQHFRNAPADAMQEDDLIQCLTNPVRFCISWAAFLPMLEQFCVARGWILEYGTSDDYSCALFANEDVVDSAALRGGRYENRR